MSDNNKPDKAHNGSGGEGDGNRSNLLDQCSLEEILPYLEWLILIVATTGFLAFQLILDAIYEEQYERDVAWIARQSKCMSPLDEDEDDDFDDFYDDDDEEEELENLMDDESEEDAAEDLMSVEMSAGATCFFDLSTCTGVPDSHLRKNEVKCKLIYFFQHPNFLVSIPVQSKATMRCGCETAGEEVAMEEEEEEEEEEEDDDDEIENLDGDPKKNPDSANGP